MTLTIASSDLIGNGTQHTFVNVGDQFLIREGVMVASTSGSSPLADTGVANIALTVAGDLVALNMIVFSGTGIDVTITETGTVTNYELVGGNAALGFTNSGAIFSNSGSVIAPDAIGVIMLSSASVITNYGNILAASAIFNLGAVGCQIVNGGTLTATNRDDAGRDQRYNNGIMIDSGANTNITNLASGVITAVGTEGAGVVFALDSGGGTLNNAGTISSLQDFGVRLTTIDLGQPVITVFNTGTISGFDGAYQGSVNTDVLVNRGLLAGLVDMGNGADSFDNRGGTVEGAVNLGDGEDYFDTRTGTVTGAINGGAGGDRVLANAAVAEVLNGGDGLRDVLELRYGAGVVLALDSAFENAGAALGDVVSGFEFVYGSFAEEDHLRGNGLTNTLFSFGGNDVLDGAGGGDVLRGGTGQDTLTGGAGDDVLRFFTRAEFGDVVTDFSSAAVGNNDHFQFKATDIGGGLAPGVLNAAFFQTRADNLAQDANDRFIFRTTDRTLWFDADGNGANVAMMVAELQAGAIVVSNDIVFI